MPTTPRRQGRNIVFHPHGHWQDAYICAYYEQDSTWWGQDIMTFDILEVDILMFNIMAVDILTFDIMAVDIVKVGIKT
jgi:hypothetical protein